jgi:hypothetical protein
MLVWKSATSWQEVALFHTSSVVKSWEIAWRFVRYVFVTSRWWIALELFAGSEIDLSALYPRANCINVGECVKVRKRRCGSS